MTEDFFELPYYRINKRLLYYLGHWPLQTRSERYFYRCTTIILMGSIILPKLIKLAMYSRVGDVEGVMRCLPMISVHIRSVIRFVNCIVNNERIKGLINRIKDDWGTTFASSDVAILQRYAKQARVLTILYMAYMASATGMYLSLPLIPAILDIVSPLNQSRDRIYLYETEYFVDPDKNYMYILLHCCITVPVSISMIVACDTMLVVYIHHACAIFKTLGKRLETLKDIKSDDNTLDITNKNHIESKDAICDEIIDCIKIHKKAIEFTALIEASGYILLFVAVSIDTAAMTLIGFRVVTSLDQPGEAIRNAIFTIGEIIHIFAICWQGNMVLGHSERISIDIYYTDWCNIPSRARKLLILMMIRCMEPCKLTAGKIFVLSMENFATVLKTSMSYFTVLLSMR